MSLSEPSPASPTAVPAAADAPSHAHDAALLAHVRPDDWRNPDPAPRYDLVVIGAGTAGLVSAAIGAGLGARVALVERHRMGGDCLNVGCVPSKALLAAARRWRDARLAAAEVGGPPVAGDGDPAAVLARMRALRAQIAPVDGAPRFRDLGVDVFFGEARFASGDTVQLSGTALRFRRAIVATGARPAVPDIPGLAESGYLTNETVFDLPAPPERLVVVGGGPVGCELAQAFARLGSTVTLLEADERLLVRDDADAARIVTEAIAADGVQVLTRARVASVARRASQREVTVATPGGEHIVPCDAVLVATGRTPSVASLELARAGIAHDAGGIRVNDRLRTSNRRVYAIGDCIDGPHHTHAADAQARLAVPNALFFGLGGGRHRALVVPWCTYTDPEVAHVGISAAVAAARGGQVETLTVPLAELDRAVLEGVTSGFLRLHLAAGSDRILGATLVAPHAGDMIGELAVAVTHRVGLGRLGATIRPYPSLSELTRRAADQWRRRRLTPRARALLAAWLRALR